MSGKCHLSGVYTSNLSNDLDFYLGQILSLYEAKYLGQIFSQTFLLHRETIFGPNKIPNRLTNWMCRRRLNGDRERKNWTNLKYIRIRLFNLFRCRIRRSRQSVRRSWPGSSFFWSSPSSFATWANFFSTFTTSGA